MAYSDKVLDHYENPRNVGSFDKGDKQVGTGMVGAPACGDVMRLQIKVGDDGIIEDAKFKTYGCGSAIASSSLLTEWVKGKTLDEAMKITNQDVADELGGLPGNKMHCSNLGADALHKAIDDFRQNRVKQAKKKAEPAPKTQIVGSCCPYCDGPIEGLEEVCGTCHVEFGSCDECGELMNKKGDKCPHCGATTVRV